MTPAADDVDDEVVLPAFEDALWAELRAAHERGPGAAPTRPRRSGLLVAAVVLVVAAQATGAVLARSDDDGSTVVGATASSPATDGPTTDAPTSTTSGPERDVLPDGQPPPPPPTAEARDAAAAIREGAETTVQLTEDRDYGVLVSRSWADEASDGLRVQTLRGDGSLAFDLGLAAAPPVDGDPIVDPVTRAVDHCFGEWSAGPGPTVGGQLLTLAGHLESGRLLVDGPEVVDGETLVATHFITYTVQIDPETGEVVDERWTEPSFSDGPYLDPDTWLPVLEVSPLQPGPERPGAPLESRRTFTYLDRAEGLGLLVAPVPAGFVEVDQVRTDQERTEALCW